MTTTAISTSKLPYLAHLYDHTWTPLVVGSSFKANLGPLVAPQGGSAAPPLHWTLNGGGDQITIFLPTRPSGGAAPLPGDIITLTEQGGDGSILYTGLIENVPEELGVSHGIVLAPLISELGDTPFTNNYTSATDPAQMIRDAVAGTAHCTANLATCPNTGVTGIYNFTPGNVLTVLDEARKLAGIGYYYFVDEIGQVWFGSLDTGKSPIYTIRQGVEFSTRKLDTPIDVQKNYVQAFGAIAPNTTTPLVATYDQTGSSVIGKRALIPPLQYPAVTDVTTLQNIVNTVGAVLNTPPVAVEVDLPAYGTRISLAPNLISNPSFESSVGQSAWITGAVGTGASTLDTAAPHGGRFALKQTNPSVGNYGSAFQPVGFPVAAGQILLLAVWAKASAGATLGPFRITFANPGANISTAGIASAQPSAQAGTSVIDSSPTLTTSYALYTHLVTVPAGFAWAFIELYANGTGVATAFWDDVIVFPTQGATIRYWEPAVQTLVESETDSGGYSAVYPILETTWDGGLQHVIAGTLSYQPDDFQAEIERMINRSVASTVISQLLPITPGQIVNATTGGPSSPASTAWVFAQWSTGIDNTSQTNNSYVIVKWTPNAAGDNVARYEIRYSKNADGNYYYDSVPAGVVDGGGRGFDKIAGLIQNTSYTFEIRAINTVGQAGPWSSTQAITTGNDTTAPAVPTGLVAIKTPRGALVGWNASAAPDLKGYHLQVSVGGGAYVDVTVDALATSAAYVAPSGTATGTSLTFQIGATDWSGNFSGYSAPSSAVNTDGVIFDELLAGNLQVFGLLTAGGLETASSGQRLVVDATSLRLYDGSNQDYGAPSGVGVTVELTATGSGFFQGTVSASGVYGSTIATSAAMGQTGAGPGFKLSGGVSAAPFLDFFTVATTLAGERFYFAKDNLTPFALVGILAAGLMTFARAGADTVSETFSATGGPNLADAIAIATFKPSGTAALVAAGAFNIVQGGSVTPAFAQTTVVNHLLVAWVACNSAVAPGISTPAGWTKAVEANGTHVDVGIWYKVAAGADANPNFTATLVAPSAADNDAQSITTAGTVSASHSSMTMVSFTPASNSISIALVQAGAFATGSASTVSPAFSAPTGVGNLLVALVSGNIGTTGGGTANVGSTAGPSSGVYDGNSSGGTNTIIMGPYTMPQHGTITSITLNASGQSGTPTVFACLWDSSGTLIADVSQAVANAAPPVTHTWSGFNVDAPSGSSWYVGMWWVKTSLVYWGVNTGGTSFKFKNGQNSIPGVGGYTNCAGSGQFPNCGSATAYATYTIVSPGTDITTTATGWTKAAQAIQAQEETQVWYKPNSSAAEPAPTFTSSFGIEQIYAQLLEFSGVVTASPVDKSGTVLQGAASTSMTDATSGVDAQSGDLVVVASRWVLTGAATISAFADVMNNASATELGNSGAQSVAQHAGFAYGVVPVPSMHAQVAEFSGTATVSPLDQVGSANQTTASGTIQAAAAALDAGTGNLIITASRWQQTAISTASFAATINNATAVQAGSSGAMSLAQHSNFEYGIVSASTSGEVLQLTSFVALEAITTNNVLPRGFVTTQYSSDGNSSLVGGRKARGTSSTPLSVQTNDALTGFMALGFDGTGWVFAGLFGAFVSSSPSAGIVPAQWAVQQMDAGGTLRQFTFPVIRQNETVAMQPQFIFVMPTDPTGNGSSTFLMQGLGGVVHLTPSVTGRVKVDVTGTGVSNSVAGATGGSWGLRYGTGTAPANGAALTGTAASPIQTWTEETATFSRAVAMSIVITGLTLGTAYWFDIQLANAEPQGIPRIVNIAFVVTEF